MRCRIRRRDVMLGLVLAGLSPATGQSRRGYRLAVLHPTDPIEDMRENGNSPYMRAFFAELRRLGYVEGYNLLVERRSGEGRSDRYDALVREVVAGRPDAIVAWSRRLVQEVAAAERTIPVVAHTTDPVPYGLAHSLARPGRNVTGVSVDVGIEVQGKYVELLLEAIPKAARVGFLISRPSWDSHYGRAMRATALRAGIDLIGPPLDDPIDEAEYRRVITRMKTEGADALIVGTISENSTFRSLIAELTEGLKLPAIHPHREAVESGGLMAYTPDRLDIHRRMAATVDQILRGASPAEMPFHQPAKFEIVLNLRAARSFGIELPVSLLARADTVIE